MHQPIDPTFEESERELFPQIQVAEELLASRLTQDDRKVVHNYRKDLGRLIRWGKLRKEILPGFLAFLEDVCFPGEDLCDEKLFKEGTFPLIDEFTDAEDIIFNSSDPRGLQRRHLLILETATKVLGILKSAVTQQLADLATLSQEEETWAKRVIEEAQAAGMTIEVGSEGYTDPELMPPPLPVSEEEIEVVADITLDPLKTSLKVDGECKNGGIHARTIVRKRRVTGGTEKILQCRDCLQILGKSDFVPTQTSKKKKECTHSNAQWDEGEEGRKAHCSDCEKSVDPAGFQWQKAGLEPYHDDPEADEVITLQTY